jgi:hypothetical protein
MTNWTAFCREATAEVRRTGGQLRHTTLVRGTTQWTRQRQPTPSARQ